MDKEKFKAKLMAKLQAPLHSISARGTIAKNLTFSMRKSGAQVRWQKKQKDVETSARTVQRDKFKVAVASLDGYDFGIQQFGYFLVGGKTINISKLPLLFRAPQFACYLRDWLNQI